MSLQKGALVWVCLFSLRIICGYSKTETVFIDGRNAIGRTDEQFICATLDWWPPSKCDFGTCAWGRASFLNLDLENKILLKAVQGLSPLMIRMGGTLQDKVTYLTEEYQQPCVQFIRNESLYFNYTQGCFPSSRWDQLNRFVNKAGANIVFGLNALYGRSIRDDGLAEGAWDPTNSESLIRYTVKKRYVVHGWEFGNELTMSGHNLPHVPADQYAYDTMVLHNILQDAYKNFEPKPMVLGPGGYINGTWYHEYIAKAGQSLNVATHHIYNLGPGVQENLVEKILDPAELDNYCHYAFGELHNILTTTPGTSAVAWVGEAGGAFHSGRNNVTNTFVFSFWYLDQLGMSATYDTKKYCRQTLIGGNYGLLDTTTFIPNPDYYSALLWNKLMGRNVLSTSFSGTNKIRVYSHCAKQSTGITILLINLDGDTTIQANVDFNGAMLSSNLVSNEREEYHLTAKDGNLQSRTMLLNGDELSLDSDGNIPDLKPLLVNSTKPITVAPFSIAFVHIPYVLLPACEPKTETF